MPAVIYDRKAVIKGDLENRLEQCREYCLGNGLEVVVEITEYHRGIGFPKPGLAAVLTAAQSVGKDAILVTWTPNADLTLSRGWNIGCNRWLGRLLCTKPLLSSHN